MAISQRLQNHPTHTAFSFEVLPPLKGNGTGNLFRTIDMLREFQPEYINITNHRSEYIYTPRPDGTYQRQRLRRRPGSIAVASAIMQKYAIRVVPHVVCSGATREDIEYMLIDLQFLGLTDLLLLRGDKARDEARYTPTPNGYTHTSELIDQVNRYNQGQFEDGTPIRNPGEQFHFGVACYPEKHEEAPNLDFDIQMLKRKQDMGAEYAVSQMCFDNEKFFAFERKARAAGVTIPLLPAIKPLSKLSQFNVLPKTFHIDLPETLSHEAEKCKTDEEMTELGVEWGVAQCRELKAHGAPAIHFYTNGGAESIRRIAKEIF